MEAVDTDLHCRSDDAMMAAKTRRAVTFAPPRSAAVSDASNRTTRLLSDKTDMSGSDFGDDGEELVDDSGLSPMERLHRMSQSPGLEMPGLEPRDWSDEDQVEQLMQKMNELMAIAARAASPGEEVASEVQALHAAISRAASRRGTVVTADSSSRSRETSVALSTDSMPRSRGRFKSEAVLAKLERMMGHIRAEVNGQSDSDCESLEDSTSSRTGGNERGGPCHDVELRAGRWAHSDSRALTWHLADLQRESCKGAGVRVSYESLHERGAGELDDVGSRESSLSRELQRLRAQNHHLEERARESQSRVVQLEEQLERTRQALEEASAEHRHALTLANQDTRELSEMQASHLRGLQNAIDLRGRLRAREREVADLRWSMEGLARENERLKSCPTAPSPPAWPLVTRSASATPVPRRMLWHPVQYDSALPCSWTSRPASHERHSAGVVTSVGNSGGPVVSSRACSRERCSASLTGSASYSFSPGEVPAREVKLGSPVRQQLFFVSAPCQRSS